MTGARLRGERLLPLVLVALGLAVLTELWARPGLVATSRSDALNSVLSLSALERRAWAAEGRWPPAWDPSNNAGQPANAFPVAMYTSPFHWLCLVLPADRAADLVMLLYVLLSGLAMLACARRFGLSPPAAFFCGAAYMLSYRVLCLLDAGWPWALAVYAWTPLLFVVLDRLIERPEPRRAVVAAVVLALTLMGGYAQLIYDVLLALAAFLAWRACRSGPRAKRVLLAAAGASALAVLLSAPDLLPRLEFARYSTRMRPDYAFFLGRARAWPGLSALLRPDDGGGARLEYWESAVYLGWWVLPLGVVAWVRDRRRAAPLLLGLGATALLCADTPVLKLLFRFLPGFDLFRLPARVLQLGQAAAVLLAGVGLDALTRVLAPPRSALFAALACVLVVLDFAPRAGRLRARPLSELAPPPAFAEMERAPGEGRVAALGRDAAPYGTAGYQGVDLLNGNESLNLRHFIEYFFVLQTGDARRLPAAPVVWTDLRSIAKPDMLRALDVRRLVSRAPQRLEGTGYVPAGRRDDVPGQDYVRGPVSGPVYLWRDARPLGPAYFARSVRGVSDERESLESLAAADSVLDARPFSWSGEPLDLDGGSARETRRGYSEYAYDVDSRGRNFLILSQVWYPGWRARLDGVPARLYRANHALLGVVVPPGRHELTLEMTQPARRAGLVLAALGAVAAAWAWNLRRKGARS